MFELGDRIGSRRWEWMEMLLKREVVETWKCVGGRGPIIDHFGYQKGLGILSVGDWRLRHKESVPYYLF